MQNTSGERKGWIARMGWRIKVALIVAALLGALLMVVLTFIAGVATGFALRQSEQDANCKQGGGTWDEAAQMCQAKSEAVQPAVQGPVATYQCQDGTWLVSRQVDPEVVHLSFEGKDAVSVLPLLSNAGEGARYGSDTESALYQGDSLSYQDTATGASSTCKTLAS